MTSSAGYENAFAAFQLWEKIKTSLSGHKQLFEFGQLIEKLQVELDYDIGKIIYEHLQELEGKQ